MGHRIIWTDTAISRVTEIGDYIAQHDPRAAGMLVEQLFDRVELLGDQPRMGRRFPGANDPDLRQLLVRQHIVTYKVVDEDQVVIILTVRHGRQSPLNPDTL